MLTQQQLANIIFNETQSLSGTGIEQARINIAMTILNAEKAGQRRPMTAPDAATVPPAVAGIYADCLKAAQQAIADWKQGQDPTNRATHFNFRSNLSTSPFFGFRLHTQLGPFRNSYPTPALPASGIYANTYGK
ncbi:cell wall hydrolase [Acidiphilium iwatense]|uniref:Cell wall hydrolase n=1 Tax=Acidiphilium iwatense TaxID=768198 RepID=A0ABS9E2A7_9PROT|nr:cell wall hydrolase [Acidiphilium iwatense]MCF3948175.1 cell wall hydrolase [Acidiphilium iwatense]